MPETLARPGSVEQGCVNLFALVANFGPGLAGLLCGRHWAFTCQDVCGLDTTSRDYRARSGIRLCWTNDRKRANSGTEAQAGSAVPGCSPEASRALTVSRAHDGES